nr:acyltransferase family protein [Cryobacterium flavum]
MAVLAHRDLRPRRAAALVIAAGIGQPEQRLLFLLTHPVSRYVGKISYSLYLWHFPVVILLATVFATDSPVYLPLTVVLMVALSVFSFHFVEDPIRHSLWLETAQTRKRERMLRPATTRHFGITPAQAWIGALVVVTLVIVSVSFIALRGGTSSTPPRPTRPRSARTLVPKRPTHRLPSWPRGSPTSPQHWRRPPGRRPPPAFGALGDSSGAPEWVDDNCLSVSEKNAAGCVYGDPAATKTAVLLGDSMAISYMPAIRAALEPLGYNVQSLTMFSCPAVNISVAPKNASDASAATCDDHHSWVYNEVARLSPDLVIMSSLAGSIVRLASGNEGVAALTEWQTATADTITAVQGSTDHVAVLSPPPASTPFAECKTLTSAPADCTYSPSSLYQKVVATEQGASKSSATSPSTSTSCRGSVSTTPARRSSTASTSCARRATSSARCWRRPCSRRPPSCRGGRHPLDRPFVCGGAHKLVECCTRQREIRQALSARAAETRAASRSPECA